MAGEGPYAELYAGLARGFVAELAVAVRGAPRLQAAGLWRNAQSRLAANVANANPTRIRASNTS